MKAAVIEAIGQPLVVKEVPIPEPGPGEILVKIEASGVCNGDVDAHAGDFPTPALPQLPRIPGHRGAGTVEAVGADVTRVAVGDRVGVPLVHRSCGHCEYCFNGQHMLCSDVVLTGFQVDGGYAQYVRADADYVGRIPDGLSMEQAAHLTCTGVTAWGALKAAELEAGQWCAVFGLGAVGQYTVQYAKAFGLRVVAVSAHDEALDIARGNGAEVMVNSRADDPAKYIRKQIGGVHAAICNSIKVEPFVQCFHALRRKGTLVAIGLPVADLPIPIFSLIMKEITVRGSFVGSRNDLEAAYHAAARLGIRLDTEEAPLDAVNAVFRRIRAGTTSSRILLRPWTP